MTGGQARPGKVYLVGAGPGDPGLITVKGLQCIQKADVIVYDRLAGESLLRSARPDAELIYVGKSPEQHAFRQAAINRLLCEQGLAGKVVTRLKGGDPFVFGRGGEEAAALREAGVPFEIVPGVTSAVAVPAYAGIPVTHRGYTTDFAVITGNEDPTKGDSGVNWPQISTGVGTLVFLMGMSNLPQITAKLMEYGRSPDTPVAVIRWGTRPEQRTLTGMLQTIAGQVQRAGFQNPAVIVVGEVVRLREQLAWFEHRPLFGKRIVVTRARQQASAFAAALAELGAEPWEFPAIAITGPIDPRPLTRAIMTINHYAWIIFTSPNGVESFFNRYFALGRDIRELTGIQLGAIGPQTAKALEKFGLKVAFVPPEYRAEAIIAGLKDFNWTGVKVLLPRADIARKVLATGLADLGAVVDDVIAYRTVRGDGDAVLLRQLLGKREIQAVTFTSSSTVRNFVEMLGTGGDKERQELLNGVVLASIGPVTSGTLREAGLWVDVEASEYTIPGLTRALLQYWNHPVQ